MVRPLVLLLVLLNLVFWAWSQGHLAGLGWAPAAQSEPERLAQQIRPHDIEVLTEEQFQRLQEAPASDPVAPEDTAAACLTTGPIAAAQVDGVRKLLESTWPAGSWEMRAATLPPRWIVYRGKFSSPALMQAKRDEIAALNIPLYPLNDASLEPGLSMGSFATQALAAQALEQMLRRGLQTARVVKSQGTGSAFVLRLPPGSGALAAGLGEIKALAGTELLPCGDGRSAAR